MVACARCQVPRVAGIVGQRHQNTMPSDGGFAPGELTALRKYITDYHAFRPNLY